MSHLFWSKMYAALLTKCNTFWSETSVHLPREDQRKDPHPLLIKAKYAGRYLKLKILFIHGVLLSWCRNTLYLNRHFDPSCKVQIVIWYSCKTIHNTTANTFKGRFHKMKRKTRKDYYLTHNPFILMIFTYVRTFILEGKKNVRNVFLTFLLCHESLHSF